MDYNTLLNLRTKNFPKNLALFYDKPLRLVKGEKQYLYCEDNKKHLDCYNNVAHVGHCHPRLAKVAFENLSTLNTNTRYLHDNIVNCSQKLLSIMPEQLKICVFVNSGSEANDLALRMANYHSKKKGVICMEYAYHGSLSSLLPISEYKYKDNLEFKQDHVFTADLPNTYLKPEKTVTDYANEFEQICQKMIKNGHQVGTYIHESFPSCAGQIEFPDGYLQKIYEIVRKYGGTIIADEVQSGFGRTGKNWWHFQNQNVIPDIVTIGKPFGNGFPLAAVICTQAVADSFNNGMEYFNTFAGSQLAMAIGLEVINIVIEEQLMQNALITGEYLKKELLKLKEKYHIIGDVRGLGLLLGVELVKDRVSKKAATSETKFIINEMKNNNILIGTDGRYNNVIKIKPPLCFNIENCNQLVQSLEMAIKKHYETCSKL